MAVRPNRPDAFAAFAWGVLAYNVLVVLWGAVVRATGSGAGCGEHWPLCNGVAVPISPQIETVIEYIHRVMSGVSLAAVGVLGIWAFRRYGPGHRVRAAAAGSVLFILSEALLGAGLVLFGYVAHDTSIQRVVSISLHLVNTFVLLAMLTLTAWWASGGAPVQRRDRGALTWLIGFAFLGVVTIGVSGAITALGDTLFPSESLAAGLSQDTSPTSHFLIRLRVIHPVIAILVGAYLLLVVSLGLRAPGYKYDNLGWVLRALVLAQLAAGVVNVVLLAPVWMQIVHLLLADAIWIALVLFGASVLAVQPAAPQAFGAGSAERIGAPGIAANRGQHS